MPSASKLSTSISLSCSLVGLLAWGSGSASPAHAAGTPSFATATQAGEIAQSSAHPPPGLTEAPGQADAFANSVGVNTWFTYSTEAYTTQFPAVSKLLIDSGIKHIRDSGPTYDGAYLRKMDMFARHGIHHSVGMNIHSTPAQVVAALKAAGPGNIDFIEPENEYDTYARQDPNWVRHIVAEQKTIWKAVRSNPAFNGVTVLGPGFASLGAYAMVGPLDAYEDAGSLHTGTCNRNPGTSSYGENLPGATRHVRESTTFKPIMTTEVGFDDNSNLTHVCTTPDSTVARYDPRLVAIHWNAGEPRTYIFQFADDPSYRNPFAYLGLVTVRGTPKPQYTALQSMLGLVSDPGPAFRPAALHYAVSGQLQNVEHTLLQKRDGTYVMMLWIEQPRLKTIYDPTVVPVPPQQISLSIHGMAAVTDYTYDTSTWTLSPQNLTVKAGTVNLTVTDAISFVEIR